MPFIIIIGLVAADALTIIAIAAGALDAAARASC